MKLHTDEHVLNWLTQTCGVYHTTMLKDLKAYHKLFPLLMKWRECWESSAMFNYQQAANALAEALQDPKPERRKADRRRVIGRGDRRGFQWFGNRRETT
jgi:hypothetical protein